MSTYSEGKLEGCQIPIVSIGTIINKGEFVISSILNDEVILRHESGREDKCTQKMIESMIK